MEQSNPDLLKEYENEIHLVPVGAGLRFANYIIDVIIFYIMMMGVGAVWGLSLVSQGVSDAATIEQDINSSTALLYLISFLTFLAYYTLFEAASKGRTIGKLITGTVAVKDDGTALTFKEALLRSLCRMIPFEPFSAFGGRPWHDTITHTMVIKKPR
jgi:uncharacterized RDD family membrane protein YckC